MNDPIVPVAAARRVLTAAEVAAYHKRGFTVVRDLYTRAEMQQWKTVLGAQMRAEGLLALDRAHNSGVRVWMVHDLHPTMLAAMGDTVVPPILRQLVGPDLEFLSAKAVFKDGKVDFGSPWHQDWFYWGGAPKLSVWIALDDARKDNGCLRVLPGSHRGTMPHTQFDDGRGFGNRIAPPAAPTSGVLDVEIPAGSAIFFHDLLAHSSYDNTSGGDRWCFISTYRAAAVRDPSTIWAKALLLSGHSVNAP